MRRLFTVMLSLALLAAVPTAASAATVFNETGSAIVVEAYWGHETPDGWTGGSASTATLKGGPTTMYYFQYTEGWVLCDDGGTPEELDDDVWGFISTFDSGEGSASLRLNGRKTHGHASGVVDVYSIYVNDCTGEITETLIEGVPITVHLDSTSPLIRERGSGVFHVPGVDNDRYRFASVYRLAGGTVNVDGSAIETDGVMGKTSWRVHFNG